MERAAPGFVAALSVGAVLTAIILGLGYFEGGKEGVCWGESEFYREHLDAAAGWRMEYSLWPPGQTCVALRADGGVLAERTYPEREDWALAVALFAAPLALRDVWCRLRRQRSGTSSAARPAP